MPRQLYMLVGPLSLEGLVAVPTLDMKWLQMSQGADKSTATADQDIPH